MLKTEYFARFLYRFTADQAFCLGLAFVVMAAASVCAGEPVMTLAMADHQSPVESHVLLTTSLPSILDRSITESIRNSPAVIHPDKEAATEVATEMRLEKLAATGQADGLQLVHKNLSASSRSNVSFSVQAGYGRIWGEQSMLQQISAGHQETGCAYVRANVSF